MSVQALRDRLAMLGQISLARGAHPADDPHMCAMEAVAWLSGEARTDGPQCASPVLRAYVIRLNDDWDAEQRQKLKPYLPRILNTAGDGLDETRSFLAADWLIRTYTSAWLDLAGLPKEAAALRDHRRIVDMVALASIEPHYSAAYSAARSAAGSAAYSAAYSAARSALAPTVTILQDSALDLLDRMIAPTP